MEVPEGQFQPEGTQGVNEYESETTPEAVEETPKVETPKPGDVDFDPNQWSFKYKGKPFLPKDRNHLMSLASQGLGATQRIEEYNKKEAELEQMRNQYSKYADLDKNFQSNPEFAQRVFELQQQIGQGEQEIDPNVAQIKAELQELKQWKEQQSMELVDRQLDNEMNELKKSHSNHNWELDEGDGTLTKRIMKHAYDNNFPTLEAAYRDFMWDSVQTNAKGQAIKQMTGAQKAAHRQGVVQPAVNSGVVPKKPAYNKGDSWNDVAEKAVKSLGD